MTKARTTDFSFAEHAKHFDAHIRSSIPGYEDGLLPTCVGLSRRFVQTGTIVVDVGCSSGHLLASVREANQAARPNVNYLGLDCEAGFGAQWNGLREDNLGFEVCDARAYPFENVSTALSLFTIQFMRPADKLPLLTRICDGLVEGGALIIGEKTLAPTSRLQDAWTFPYYDHKLKRGFTSEEILDKERSLRGKMTLWTEAELMAALSQAGFHEITPIWRNLMFVGILALKSGREAVTGRLERAPPILEKYNQTVPRFRGFG
jgi:tRNA (cmo5U34)-methyltransferase